MMRASAWIIETVFDHKGASGPQLRNHRRAEGVQDAGFAREACDSVVTRPVLLNSNDLIRPIDFAVPGTICTDVGAESLCRRECYRVGLRQGSQALAQFDVESRPLLRLHLICGLGAGTEHAGHPSALVTHR